MNVPKYIEKALERRARAAGSFLRNDCIIADFLEKHDIEVESYDIGTGCESLANPIQSSMRIYKAILGKEDKAK